MVRSAFVLVVDDDPDIRDSLAELLAAEGHRVAVAANGEEALKLIRAYPDKPCLILLDLMMPVMNGWQFAEAMAADPELADIPVCIITAGMPDPPANIVCVMSKPFDIDDLLRIVTAHS